MHGLCACLFQASIALLSIWNLMLFTWFQAFLLFCFLLSLNLLAFPCFPLIAHTARAEVFLTCKKRQKTKRFDTKTITPLGLVPPQKISKNPTIPTPKHYLSPLTQNEKQIFIFFTPKSLRYFSQFVSFQYQILHIHNLIKSKHYNIFVICDLFHCDIL